MDKIKAPRLLTTVRGDDRKASSDMTYSTQQQPLPAIPNEAVEAAASLIATDDLELAHADGYDVKLDIFLPAARRAARRYLEAAAPHMHAAVWQSAYEQGVDDQKTSASNPGIAGCFCNSHPCRCFIAPARVNPYRSQS